MLILEILILCLAVSILTGYCIRTGMEGRHKFNPTGRARFVNGKWRVK